MTCICVVNCGPFGHNRRHIHHKSKKTMLGYSWVLQASRWPDSPQDGVFWGLRRLYRTPCQRRALRQSAPVASARPRQTGTGGYQSRLISALHNGRVHGNRRVTFARRWLPTSAGGQRRNPPRVTRWTVPQPEGLQPAPMSISDKNLGIMVKSGTSALFST